MSINFSRKEIYSPKITLRRTLRVGDVALLEGEKSELLPPRLGTYPLALIANPLKRQALFASCCRPGEALYLKFEAQKDSRKWAPCLLMVRIGQVNAISGLPWDSDQVPDFSRQNFIVSSPQSWLDGYKVAGDQVRQFVFTTIPVGADESPQLEIKAYFLTPEALEHHQSHGSIPPFVGCRRFRSKGFKGQVRITPGGLLKQKVYLDPFGEDCWAPQCVGSAQVLFLSPEDFESETHKKALAPLQRTDLEGANFPDGNRALWHRAFDSNYLSVEACRDRDDASHQESPSIGSIWSWLQFWK